MQKARKRFGRGLQKFQKMFEKGLEEVWNPRKRSHQGGVILMSFGGHVDVILDVILGSCWCHFGVSDTVDSQVRFFLRFGRQLGAQVGLQVGASWTRNRYLTSLKFRIRF